MKNSNTIKFIAINALLTLATGVFAQNSSYHAHTARAASATPAATYAGEQSRAIKALSAQEAQDWLDGKGMGLSRAAELNRHPGPMHVLELAQPLQLKPSQREATTQLLTQHKAHVRQLGAQLVEAERAMDQAFASGNLSAPQLSAMVQRIGTVQTAIRESHLQTHLAQTALLSPSQITQYSVLRGYGN